MADQTELVATRALGTIKKEIIQNTKKVPRQLQWQRRKISACFGSCSVYERNELLGLLILGACLVPSWCTKRIPAQNVRVQMTTTIIIIIIRITTWK